MPRENVKVKSKCGCNLGFMVIAWILAAIGIWALVAGFATQLSSGAPTVVNVVLLGWYFLGVLLIGLAKMAKWKSCGRCNMHK
ncbi:MAG: hypothetical protein AABX14_02545 [Candidatus Aenigmatarchaeota archaeon]